MKASAITVSSELDLPRPDLFRATKLYLLTQSTGKESGEKRREMIRLEDASAGLLRFRYVDGAFRDDAALVEIIEVIKRVCG